MKKDYIKLFLIITLSIIVAGLIFWRVTFVDEIQHQLSVFAIVAVIFTTISSVYTVSFNNRKAKEREYEFHLLKEKQKVFEHFYNAYFEMLNNIKKTKKELQTTSIMKWWNSKKD